MINKSKILVMVLFLNILLVATLASSQTQTLGMFEQNKALDLIQSCSNSTSICDSCNITTVKNPDSSILIQNVGMQKQNYFNYTLNSTQTTTIGEYSVSGFCMSGSQVEVFAYTYRINKTGEQLSTAEGIIYVVFLMAAILLFVSCLFLAIKIPWVHERNEDGYIVSINDLKYVKIFMSGITYVMLLFIFGILYNVMDSFLFLVAPSKFFNWLFQIMLAFLWPVIVFSFLVAILTFWDNVRKKALLTRGLSIE